jgi:hypothetical protein
MGTFDAFAQDARQDLYLLADAQRLRSGERVGFSCKHTLDAVHGLGQCFWLPQISSNHFAYWLSSFEQCAGECDAVDPPPGWQGHASQAH